MSRPMKFRAWSEPYKQWCGGTNYIDGVWLGWICRYGKDIMTQDIILEQYTGLTDKNGKEIYEGDIIKQLMYVLDGKECITTWVVRWNNDEFCYDLHRVSGAMYGDSMLSTCEGEGCEVIGNIHDNPELLEDEDEDDTPTNAEINDLTDIGYGG